MIKHLVWNSTTVSIMNQELKAGRSIISSTDTVLGLLATCSKQGFERLNQIKGRYEKPYLILIADLNMAQVLVDHAYHERLAIFQSCWPGPLTCIFPAAANVPEYMQSADGTIGLRIPAHKGLLQLLQLTGPLFSTSANRAGQPVPDQISDLDAQLLSEVDYLVLQDEQQEQKQAIASTILDCTKRDIRVIREGAFAVDEIEQKVKLTIKR